MIKVQVSDKPGKQIYVRFKFVTLNTWKYTYHTHQGTSFSKDSSQPPAFHDLGKAQTLVGYAHAYDISLANSTTQKEKYTILVAWYRLIAAKDNISYDDFDDENIFEKIKEKKHEDTIESGKNKIISETVDFI